MRIIGLRGHDLLWFKEKASLQQQLASLSQWTLNSNATVRLTIFNAAKKFCGRLPRKAGKTLTARNEALKQTIYFFEDGCEVPLEICKRLTKRDQDGSGRTSKRDEEKCNV